MAPCPSAQAPAAQRPAPQGEGARYDLHDGLLWTRAKQLSPIAAISANHALVMAMLEERSIRFVTVRNAAAHHRFTLAVSEGDRSRLEAAIREDFADDAVYIQTIESRLSAAKAQPTSRAQLAARSSARVRRAPVVRIGRLYVDPVSGLRHDLSHGCDVELWTPTEVEGEPGWRSARPTITGSAIPESILGLVRDIEPEVPIFDRLLLGDISFPIDAVYTWVDGSDPIWRANFDQHRGAAEYHVEATAPTRFRSRDELRYSLRSLFMFAPWIRHVYLVTDGQVPDFLDPGHPQLTIVDHREIAPDPSVLPVFSSNAITTWLHRIPGLSEHYLFVNDDVFFGRLVAPSLFFTAGGLCRVFPGRTPRPFGPPDPMDPPHLNVSRNVRTLIERELGRTFVNAIKHTPYPQRVSVHREMEQRFPDAYRSTARHRFRHHDDIAADQLFHYYALATGRAVEGAVRYAYINVNSSARSLDGLHPGTVDVFCLNDGPMVGPGIPDHALVGALKTHAPIPSPMEVVQ